MSDVKDSFTGTVVGTVEKVGQYKGGTYARVAYQTNPNAKYPERATAWGVGEVSEGDRVKVSGQVSVRKSERDGKTYVDTSINFPQLEVLSGSTPPESVTHAWSGPAVDAFPSDETPF